MNIRKRASCVFAASIISSPLHSAESIDSSEGIQAEKKEEVESQVDERLLELFLDELADEGRLDSDVKVTDSIRFDVN